MKKVGKGKKISFYIFIKIQFMVKFLNEESSLPIYWDELFINFSGINFLDEPNFSIQEEFSSDTDEFSLNTDELLKDLEKKLIGDNRIQGN